MIKKKKIIPLSILIILLIFLSGFAHKLIFNIVSGRVHCPEEYVGSNLTMEDSTKFTVLRRIQVDGKNTNSDKLAVFIVRFKFKNFKFETNKSLSIIPAPFLINMKGFLEKIWTFNEDTDFFQGIYQWESKEIAERYPKSFVFNLMTKRAAPGTISYKIIENTELTEYLKNLYPSSEETLINKYLSDSI
jgi:hypothetical protein